MKTSHTLLLIALALGVHNSGILESKEEWKAFVYPNANNLSTHKEIGTYSTFEQCQQASINTLRILRKETVGAYECGLNCEFNPTYGLEVCETTRD